MVLIAFPVMVLGAAAPYAIRLSVKTADEAGNVAGRLYAISTIGSLAGVFLSALLLVPLLGTRRTFIVFALSLALVAMPAAATLTSAARISNFTQPMRVLSCGEVIASGTRFSSTPTASRTYRST